MRLSNLNAFVTVSIIMLISIVGINVALAQAETVKWREIVGIIQGGTIVGSGEGAVEGVPGPWSATNGFAKVDLDKGNIAFHIRGLVFAGTNAIGTPGAVVETGIKGTLVCDTDGSVSGNSVLVDTPVVSLSPQGNAQFSGNVGSLPDECIDQPDIAFLIVVPGFERWIANGAVRMS